MSCIVRFVPFALGALTIAAASCGGRVAGGLGADASDETETAPDSGGAVDATEPTPPTPPMDAAAQDTDADADWLDALPMVDCGDAGQPVAICVEYYAFASQCFHRDAMAFACSPALIPDGAADLQSIEQSCELNLQRLMQACR